MLNPITIETERHSPIGHSYIARYAFRDSADHLVAGEDLYRLDMAMAPRPANARGQYSRHWNADRYERLGGVWMTPPGEPIRFRSDPGATVCVHCSLRPDAVADWLGADSGWNASALDKTLDLPGGRIPVLLRHLAEELRAPSFAGEAMVELITGQIAIEISRFQLRAAAQDESCGLPVWRLNVIDDRLGDGGPPPTLSELAALCGLSVRHLTRGFRVSRGQSVGDAIAARRIEQAKQLLHSDLSQKVISHRLGFASPAGFAYAFRKATGETPGAFQTRMRRGGR